MRCSSEQRGSTARIFIWWRQKLEAAMQPVPVAAPKTQGFRRGAGDIYSLISPASRKKAERRKEAVNERDRIARYLEGVARLCIEVSRQPELLPSFLAVVMLVPSTLAELAGAKRKRIAA